MNIAATIKNALLHLVYPNLCAGCGTDVLPPKSNLCIKCIHDLPATGFEKQENNIIEKALAGRVKIEKATAQFYFSKQSALQQMLHQFKYKGNKDLGLQLGLIMGNQLLESNRFKNIDALVPLPLNESKERKRGYNQAEVLCNGIAEILKIPIEKNAVIRPLAAESQTKKNRIERWQNIKDHFIVINDDNIKNKRILLVDDVFTTGATIEACASSLINVSGLILNVATLCYASKI